MKAFVAIHIAPDGASSVLDSGTDGVSVQAAYKACNRPGKVYLYEAFQHAKSKRIREVVDAVEEAPAKRRGRPPKFPSAAE